MKAIKNTRFLGFCIVAALLCSCSEESDAIISPDDDEAALIVPQAFVGEAEVIATKGDLSGIVIGTSFPVSTTKLFGVIAYKGQAAPTTDWSSPYINNYTVESDANGALRFTVPRYYPIDGEKLYFYAYSPMKGISIKAGTASTHPTATWSSLDGQTDVMAAQVTTGIAKATTGTQQQPAFAFTHKLMQLKFKVVKSSSLTDPIKLTDLKVNNASTSVSMDLVNGNVTTLNKGSLTAYSSTEGHVVTTAAAYLGTSGASVLTTKTDDLSLTVTCGDQSYDVTPNLPADAGPGKIVEITLKFTPGGLIITGIILNSSTSYTVPRAGGTFTLVTRTGSEPEHNISWLVKDADGNEVGRSTSYTNYKTATITVDNEYKKWSARPLSLYWSYGGSSYKQFTGQYTLNQNGNTLTSVTIAQGAVNGQDMNGYAGARILNLVGDYSSDAQYYLVCGSEECGPFRAGPKSYVRTTVNTTAGTRQWSIYGVNPDGEKINLNKSVGQTNSVPSGAQWTWILNRAAYLWDNKTRDWCITEVSKYASLPTVFTPDDYEAMLIMNWFWKDQRIHVVGDGTSVPWAAKWNGSSWTLTRGDELINGILPNCMAERDS